MDLFEGGSLAKKIDSKYPFKLTEIQDIMIQILEALDYMHNQKQIMHRDLKPENIIFNKKNKIVLADFGLATKIKVAKYMFHKVGTPGHCAPEIYDSLPYKPYSEVCDVYSAGIIFHILLMGFNPFDKNEKQNYDNVINNNKEGKIQFDSQEYKQIPSVCLKLLKKMLKKSPENRITVEQALKDKFFQVQEFKEGVRITSSKSLSFISLNKYRDENQKKNWDNLKEIVQYTPYTERNINSNENNDNFCHISNRKNLRKMSLDQYIINRKINAITGLKAEQNKDAIQIQTSQNNLQNQLQQIKSPMKSPKKRHQTFNLQNNNQINNNTSIQMGVSGQSQSDALLNSAQFFDKNQQYKNHKVMNITKQQPQLNQDTLKNLQALRKQSKIGSMQTFDLGQNLKGYQYYQSNQSITMGNSDSTRRQSKQTNILSLSSQQQLMLKSGQSDKNHQNNYFFESEFKENIIEQQSSDSDSSDSIRGKRVSIQLQKEKLMIKNRKNTLIDLEEQYEEENNQTPVNIKNPINQRKKMTEQLNFTTQQIRVKSNPILVENEQNNIQEIQQTKNKQLNVQENNKINSNEQICQKQQINNEKQNQINYDYNYEIGLEKSNYISVNNSKSNIISEKNKNDNEIRSNFLNNSDNFDQNMEISKQVYDISFDVDNGKLFPPINHPVTNIVKIQPSPPKKIISLTPNHKQDNQYFDDNQEQKQQTYQSQNNTSNDNIDDCLPSTSRKFDLSNQNLE